MATGESVCTGNGAGKGGAGGAGGVGVRAEVGSIVIKTKAYAYPARNSLSLNAYDAGCT